MRPSYILRRLLRTPMFTLIVVLTLAIGIGANTAIFSVIDAVLLKPLPYPEPSKLIALDHKAPGVNIEHAGMAPFLYYIYREQGRTLEDVGMWANDTVSVTGLAEPEEVAVLDVTDGLLPLLKVTPAMGRIFSAADDSPGSPETVVLTYGYWKARMGGERSAIGRRILVNGHATEVIGVLPEKFRFLDSRAALVLPMRRDRNKVFLGQFSYQAMGRLKPGVSMERASADMARLIPVALEAFPPFPGYNKTMFAEAKLAPLVKPLKEQLVGDLSGVLWVLMGTIGMVLLIACANVANLLLVRADGRRQELAIRAALGAGWGRIARELLSESVMLSVAGGIAGLGCAYGALRLLVAIAPANLPRLEDVSIDGAVLLFTLVVSLFAGLLFGLIPVFKYAGPQLGTALRAGSRTLGLSRERHRARNALVVVQVTLAMVLLIGSGLMLRTFQTLRRVEPGFSRPEQVETLRISIPVSQAKDEMRVAQTEQQIIDKIAAIPGVASVASTSIVPMTGLGWTDAMFAQDRVYSESQIPPLRRFKFVSPGFARTMGGSMVAGRDFTWTDVYERRPVVLVSENLARELWRDPAAAIGKRVRESLKAEWREVVGVVSDIRDDGVNEKAPTVVMWPILMDNFSGDQEFVMRGMAYMVRSSRTGSSGFVNEISRAVWAVNPNLPLADVHSLEEIYNKSLARTSFTLVMLAIAGAMALLLGVVGIYGVISYSVAQRTREIGIRVALGASREVLTRMFVGQGLQLAAIGVACGLIAAAGMTRAMKSLLFEVKPVDPLTYATVAAGLIAIAALASYVPALRATAVDPTEALRAD
ncbi:MAG TPA: ABC transporter permease [Bryobacteraceae bacterium]|nr:ABC transporter permease [Bryobacteraceae bacterium]